MKIIIDADACPVTAIAIDIAKDNGIPVICVCDTSHVIENEYAQTKVVDKGRDSADIAVINLSSEGDIVITQDYGVASMALAKRAKVINQSGKYYTEDNIESLMEMRYAASVERRKSSKHHLKGPKKRTKEDDERFVAAFNALIENKCI